MAHFNGGEFIIMGLPGFGLDFKTRQIIKAVQPAGFILFARNIETPHQLRDLTNELRALVKRTPIITVDQEGGRVSRLKEFMSEPPSAQQLADRSDEALIKEHGRTTGKLLRLFGFNLNLAPVLDILVDDKQENSLKGRTYGSTADAVTKNAAAFLQGMQSEGMLSCGKHFPGYSYAQVDPHNDLPKISRTKAELEAFEWKPFRALLASVDTLMVGHAVYPAIDQSGRPASLSRQLIKNIVRDEWHYPGCIITDDLDMGAIKKHYGSAKACQLAMEAGNDLLLVCHEIESVPEIANTLSQVNEDLQTEASQRIATLRERLSPPLEFSMEAAKELDTAIDALKKSLRCPPA
jgi:beta-N-acetylhexosaminidase